MSPALPGAIKRVARSVSPAPPVNGTSRTHTTRRGSDPASPLPSALGAPLLAPLPRVSWSAGAKTPPNTTASNHLPRSPSAPHSPARTSINSESDAPISSRSGSLMFEEGPHAGDGSSPLPALPPLPPRRPPLSGGRSPARPKHGKHASDGDANDAAKVLRDRYYQMTGLTPPKESAPDPHPAGRHTRTREFKHTSEPASPTLSHAPDLSMYSASRTPTPPLPGSESEPKG
jgi:hypothetical protein